jgi:hypothetical protein
MRLVGRCRHALARVHTNRHNSSLQHSHTPAPPRSEPARRSGPSQFSTPRVARPPTPPTLVLPPRDPARPPFEVVPRPPLLPIYSVVTFSTDTPVFNSYPLRSRAEQNFVIVLGAPRKRYGNSEGRRRVAAARDNPQVCSIRTPIAMQTA